MLLRLVGVLVALHYVCHCLIHNIYVEPNSPVLHIPDVASYATFHLVYFLCLATEACHLAPSGDARLDKVAHHIVVDYLRVVVGLLHHVRTRTHDTHLSEEHIDELWHLVKIGLAHDVAPLCLTWVVERSLYGVGILVHLHASELQTVEVLAVKTRTLLSEEYRSRHCYLRHDAHEEQDEREECAEEDKRNDDVEGTLDEAVLHA